MKQLLWLLHLYPQLCQIQSVSKPQDLANFWFELSHADCSKNNAVSSIERQTQLLILNFFLPFLFLGGGGGGISVQYKIHHSFRCCCCCCRRFGFVHHPKWNKNFNQRIVMTLTSYDSVRTKDGGLFCVHSPVFLEKPQTQSLCTWPRWWFCWIAM